ncbi:thiosulfate sulfurtransferase [Oleiphilus messinensis]|uniref:Sulfurtransferase n=1 Tax=Oleiphilus messinensis TaxID=141451 RepID=A0A1Y0I5Y6_9GAMM|nr:rhodanese-like domain-containing protein [Oleiphilus messinensis]ARU55892.1 thiosulfate sulfurtransferase [Oleiphilus messinensis]
MEQLPLIIEPEALVNHLDRSDLILVDLCSLTQYQEAHLPGAHHVAPAETQLGITPGPGRLPTTEALSALISRLGITPDKHVVVYDDEGGGWAGRFIWLLDCIGHTRYSYLNGGLIAWHALSLPLTPTVPPAAETTVSVTVHEAPTVSTDDLIELVNNKSVTVWDARSPQEYTGEKIVSARGGHIPGAINFEWTQAMDPGRDYRLKPLSKLEKILTDLGILNGKPIITHCQSHHRSGLTYLIAKALNQPVQAYAGSWSEWGNRTDTPIESETKVS